MKGIFSIIPITTLLLHLLIIGCSNKSLGVCGLPYESMRADGIGVESELKRFELTGYIDTTAAMMDLKITYLYPGKEKTEKPAIGVNILVRKVGETKLFLGGCSDINGQYKSFIDPGIYDIEFSYTGCNTLLVKNVSMGALHEGEVLLGIHGREQKTFVVDLIEK